MAEQITMPAIEAPPVETVVEPVTPAPLTEEVVTPLEPVVEATPPPHEGETQRRTAFQKRIDELTREKHEARRETERYKRELEAKTPTPTALTEPQAETYATTEEYVKAVAKWEVHQARQAMAQEDRTRQEDAKTQEAAARFEPLIEQARTKYADFDDITGAPIYGPQTQQLLYQSPHGAEIAYLLGKQPQEADKINRMSPMEAARAIVKLEQRFDLKPKTVSGAPAPITPVTGTAGAPKDPEKMTTEEWMAWNKQQRLEQLKANPFA